MQLSSAQWPQWVILYTSLRWNRACGESDCFCRQIWKLSCTEYPTDKYRSWQDVYSALSDPDSPKFKGVHLFLADPASQALLKKPLDPFDAPSAAAKSQFETLTSAINITPAENAAYKIKEIKEDALWLAAEAKIDEVSALRIVVLEWQKRPITRLVSGDLGKESLESDPWTSFGASILTSKPEEGSKEPAETTGSFESTPRRRKRLLRLYLSEHLHVLSVSELLIRCLDEDVLPEISESAAQAVYREFCPENDGSAFLVQCASKLHERVERITQGATWSPLEPDGDIPGEEHWLETQILEMTVIFQLIFDICTTDTEIPSSAAISALFKFLESMTFFADFAESVRLSYTFHVESLS